MLKKQVLCPLLIMASLSVFAQTRTSIGIPLSLANAYRTVIELESYGQKRISYGGSIGYNYGIRMIETAYPINSPLPIGALHNNGVCIGLMGKFRFTKKLSKFQSYLGFDVEYTHARGGLVSSTFGESSLTNGAYVASDVHYHRIKPRLNLSFRWDGEKNFFVEPFIGAAFAMHIEQNLYDKMELIGSTHPNAYDHLSGSRNFGILSLQVGVRIGMWKTRDLREK